MLINIMIEVTIAQVRRQLAEEEAASLQSASSSLPESEISASAMISMGMDIEDQQYVTCHPSHLCI